VMNSDDRLRLMRDRQTNSKLRDARWNTRWTLQAQRERQKWQNRGTRQRGGHVSSTPPLSYLSIKINVLATLRPLSILALAGAQISLLTCRKDDYVRGHFHFHPPRIAPSVHITTMALHHRHQKVRLWYGCLQCYHLPATPTTPLSGDLHRKRRWTPPKRVQPKPFTAPFVRDPSRQAELTKAILHTVNRHAQDIRRC
jgi:hypothetical protein